RPHPAAGAGGRGVCSHGPAPGHQGPPPAVTGQTSSPDPAERATLTERMEPPMPDLDDLLAALDAGQTIPGDSPLHEVMHRVSQDALRITGDLNGGYQEPAKIRDLLT